MLSEEEKREYEELKSLLYTGTISQYGKRKLIDMFEKQSKEIEELKSDLEVFKRALTDIEVVYNKNYTSNDKIKAKIEEVKDGTFDAKIVLQSLLEKE